MANENNGAAAAQRGAANDAGHGPRGQDEAAPAAPTGAAAETRHYVNEYLTNRRYGGREEGGWWYDTGEYVECHGCYAAHADAESRRNELTGHIAESRIGQHEPGSVLCNGYTEIYIEASPGEDYPERHPRYE